MELSVVTTMYCSAPYLKEFYDRTTETARKITEDYEIVFVNDGSPDNSLDLCLALYKNDRKVKIVDLSRNFGHHKAVMSGLSHAKGELVFLIDCDLEEDPENLEMFYRTFKSDPDCDVVHGAVNKTKGGILRKIPDSIFYHVFNFLTDVEVDKKESFSRLMSRRYVQSLVSHRESELFLLGLWRITGYKQVPFPIVTRFKGTSTYTTSKKIAMALNAITSFSLKPIMYVSYLGILISFAAGLCMLYLLLRKMFFGATLQGWTSLIVSIWFVGGLILFSNGIIGVYVSKIFIETKNRPYTTVKHFHQNEDE
jgi:putative glycosyltransferase